MGLLTKASKANRVVSQGGTYSWTVEPEVQNASVKVEKDDKEVTVGAKVDVLQWHATAHFAKRYRYVGLSRAAAENFAAQIAEKYVLDVQRYAVGLYANAETGVSCYMYLEVEDGTVPTCCAAVTPTRADASLWDVEVDVDATVEWYGDKPPTRTTITGLFAGIANFPETDGDKGALTYTGGQA